MRTRWGLGPVFVYEWLTASRRWQMYAFRAGFVGVLFLAVLLVWFNKTDSATATGTFDRNAHARAGEALFYGFFGTLLSVTLLVAPGRRPGPSASTRPAARCCTCSSPTCRRRKSCSASWPPGCCR